ncbi:Cation transport protein chaC [Klebsiella pneumoniae]|uniref:Cation transport protein chaC n=1 Tax=Klebsiella pneumoniae TaxID=573 RepID=A0A2X3F0Q0_KLEPN|nr:Cation transport protein chaC [Klebsiella pneumoniae]
MEAGDDHRLLSATWCKLELDDGRTVNALVFIMDPRHPLFEPDTSAQVIAPLIARPAGRSAPTPSICFA